MSDQTPQQPGWGPPPDRPPQPGWGPPTQPPAPKRRRPGVPGWIGLVVLVFLAFGIYATAHREPDTTTTPAAPAITTSGQPAATEPETTEAPKPASVSDEVSSQVRKALGDSNRKVPRISILEVHAGGRVTVGWAIDENLTEGLTKDTARLEAKKILEAIRDGEHAAHGSYKDVLLVGSYSLVDRYGNASEETVVRARYDRSTLERINFDGVNFKSMFELADDAQVHPAFVY